jgi:hypothetical protein
VLELASHVEERGERWPPQLLDSIFFAVERCSLDCVSEEQLGRFVARFQLCEIFRSTAEIVIRLTTSNNRIDRAHDGLSTLLYPSLLFS